MYQYPSQFVSNIKDTYGKTGIKWLEQLPSIITQLEKDWDIKSITPIPDLTYSFVATAELENNVQTILKIVPCNNHSDTEIEWYKFQTQATPKLHKANQNLGALLIEKLTPGKTIKDFVINGQDDKATEIICKVINDLETVPAKNNTYFKHVTDLNISFEALENRVEKLLLDKAKKLFKNLTLDSSQDVILHGDLHHDNILSSNKNWKAIDPHGYIGPKSFEVGAMLRNPHDCFPTNNSLEKTINNRCNILYAKLPFKPQEINGWLYVYTIIAAGWSMMDHNEIPSASIDIINILYPNLCK